MFVYTVASQYKGEITHFTKGVFTSELHAWEAIEKWYYELIDYILKNDGRLNRVKIYPAGIHISYKIYSASTHAPHWIRLNKYDHYFIINKCAVNSLERVEDWLLGR